MVILISLLPLPKHCSSTVLVKYTSYTRFNGKSAIKRLVFRHKTFNIYAIFIFSYACRGINYNWSATKQRLHPQSVAEISRHSVLSGDRIRQCGTGTSFAPQGHRSVSVSRHFLLQAPQCPCSVRKRFSRDHMLSREVETRLPDCGRTLRESSPLEPTSSYASIDFRCQWLQVQQLLLITSVSETIRMAPLAEAQTTLGTQKMRSLPKFCDKLLPQQQQQQQQLQQRNLFAMRKIYMCI